MSTRWLAHLEHVVHLMRGTDRQAYDHLYIEVVSTGYGTMPNAPRSHCFRNERGQIVVMEILCPPPPDDLDVRAKEKWHATFARRHAPGLTRRRVELRRQEVAILKKSLRAA